MPHLGTKLNYTFFVLQEKKSNPVTSKLNGNGVKL